MFLHKLKNKQFFRQHNILIEGEFTIELSSDVAISVGRIVWVTTERVITSDVYYIIFIFRRVSKRSYPYSSNQ